MKVKKANKGPGLPGASMVAGWPKEGLLFWGGHFQRSRRLGLASLRVVVAIVTAGLSAFAAGSAGFFRREAVPTATLVRGTATFAGDAALQLRVHASETALAGVAGLTVGRSVLVFLGLSHDVQGEMVDESLLPSTVPRRPLVVV
jgi:hypothetical protein